jgi:hypothetical protein
MGTKAVQIMDGETKKQVTVEIGIQTPLEAEIINGLNEGTTVILN